MTTICLRMVHPNLDGQWMEVLAMPPSLVDGYGYTVPLVATGSVEWDGDKCAEVFVPADLLFTWRRNHAIDI
jgi:hypothetical protein